MPTLDLQPLLDAVRQSAALCQRVQQTQFTSSDKAGREPVTIADYGSQAILCRAIGRAYPDDAVLAEEHGSQFMELVSDPQRAQITQMVGEILGEAVTVADIMRWLDYGKGRQAARTWVIDPIDGTQGFLSRRRYAIGVGLLVEGHVVGGVIGSPAYGDGRLFYALDGTACGEPLAGGEAHTIHVSDGTDGLRVVESVDVSHTDPTLTTRIREAAGLASADVIEVDSMDKYAMVACGDADLYLRLPANRNYRHKSWDHAAGTALVQAAGGVVTDLDGTPLDFSQGVILGNSRGMVVSNGWVHERVVRAIREVLGAE
jgi:3'(2'), 5'-bisphosphate nucleotidase